MKAVKGNKAYIVDKTTKKKYIEDGFDIYDDDGKMIEAGKSKTVSYEEYEKIEKALEKALEKANKTPNNAKVLKEQNIQLLSEIEEQNTKIADLEKELEEAKKVETNLEEE